LLWTDAHAFENEITLCWLAEGRFLQLARNCRVNRKRAIAPESDPSAPTLPPIEWRQG
jgi:hypothetical protein